MEKNVQALRAAMKQESIDAYLVFSGDPHRSEFPHDYWNVRQWITGFTGSVGTAVITGDRALLFTDPMYKIMGKDQLKDTPFELVLMKDRFATEYYDWLLDAFKNGAVIAMDGRYVSACDYAGFRTRCDRAGITLKADMDLISPLWEARPSLGATPIFAYGPAYSGRSAQEKIAELREALKNCGAEYYVTNTLDDIAWLYNFRGRDIPCTPVAHAYALLGVNNAALYIDERKVDAGTEAYLREEGITVKPYGQVFEDLGALHEKRIALERETLNSLLFGCIPADAVILEAKELIAQYKIVKHPVEIENHRKIQLREGVNHVKFQHWLSRAMAAGEMPTELTVQEKIMEFLGLAEGFLEVSFKPIVAYRAHAAMPHYAISAETNCTFECGDAFLYDTGGQYWGGTTDITRTFALGDMSMEFRRDYTCVLQGLIALSTLIFPYGTCCTHVCAIALAPIWRGGTAYTGGLGHGVGNCLNVHELPPILRYLTVQNDVFEPDMITTIEPGVYKEGKYGIRIENMAVVKPYKETEDGLLLHFETLTKCPIDVRPVLWEMLSPEEAAWITEYNAQVEQALAPYLNEEEARWLTGFIRECLPVEND